MELIDSPTLNAQHHALKWLVRSILVAGQPAVIGAPPKHLKTSIAIDLAISVGAGQRFLGEFPVPDPGTAIVFSAEDGLARLKNTAQRVCAAKDITLDEANVLWGSRVPQLTCDEALEDLAATVRRHNAKLVVIDPLYIAFAGKNIDPRNVYDIGPALKRAAHACLDEGATPVLVHHTTKSAGKLPTQSQEGGPPAVPEPLTLSELAFSGVTEFVRQWLLLRQAAAFDPVTGRHDLLLSVGGSAGHRGVWRLVIDEGPPGRDLDERGWAVTLTPRPKAPNPTADSSRRSTAHEPAARRPKAKSKPADFPRTSAAVGGQASPKLRNAPPKRRKRRGK